MCHISNDGVAHFYFKKNCCKPISRILYTRRSEVSIIYLPAASQLRCICLPPLTTSVSTEIPQRATRYWHRIKVYMAFQPTGFIRSINYLTEPCALTARFHPYPDYGRGGYFL